MVEILSGRTGTVQMVFGWLLAVYPALTLPLLLNLFLRAQRRERRQLRVDQGAPEAVDASSSEPSLRGRLFVPPSGGPTSPSAEQDSVLRLEQRVRVLERAAASASQPADAASARPLEPGTMPSGRLPGRAEAVTPSTTTRRAAPAGPPEGRSAVRADDLAAAARITAEELAALTAPELELAASDRPEVESRRCDLGKPALRLVAGPGSPANVATEDAAAAAGLTDLPGLRPARTRRTLEAARRVASNPRMKRWIRDVASDLLLRTGS